MKTREGFVSNSSSSSFVISKHFLSPHQLDQIKNHVEVARGMGMDEYASDWTISENEAEVEGNCDMDNFSMDQFLERIGVNMDKVHWGHY